MFAAIHIFQIAFRPLLGGNDMVGVSANRFYFLAVDVFKARAQQRVHLLGGGSGVEHVVNTALIIGKHASFVIEYAVEKIHFAVAVIEHFIGVHIRFRIRRRILKYHERKLRFALVIDLHAVVTLGIISAAGINGSCV